MNLIEFVNWAVSNGPWEGHNLDGFDVQDRAVACGILVCTKYDPDKHGTNNCDAEKGDEWFEFSDEFKASIVAQEKYERALVEIERLRGTLSRLKQAFDDRRISGSVYYEDTGLWPLADFFAFNSIE